MRQGLAGYRAVLGLRGAVPFSAAGLVARLPISMVGLGLVILVSDRTGSYARAGAVSAAYIGANALLAVPLARLVDRRGQGTVLGPAATLSAVGLALVVLSVERGLTAPWPHLCAVLAGACLPNMGAAVRARWSHVVTDRTRLETAFALESVNDELVFIVGPTLVTLLASAFDPVAGLVTAGVASLVGTWTFSRLRATEPPRSAHGQVEPGDVAGRRAARPPMPWGRLVPLVGASVMLGVLFGGAEVATVAFADEQDRAALAGVLLAVWALGSLLSGLAVGSMTFRSSPAVRYRWGIVALAVLMAPLPLVTGMGVLAVVLFLAGFAISPTMIAASSWIEQVVPPTRLNEGMTLFGTGLVAGVAPGAAVVGAVVDRAGASVAFGVPAAAGAIGALLAYATADRRVPVAAPPGAAPDAEVGSGFDPADE